MKYLYFIILICDQIKTDGRTVELSYIDLRIVFNDIDNELI